MVLHLFQQLPYKRLALPSSQLQECWSHALAKADNMETGSELCIVLDPSLKAIDYGWKKAPSGEERLLVAQGLPDKEQSFDFSLAPGTWNFEQLDHLPEKGTIREECGPYVAQRGKNPLYLRLIKENALVLVVQLLWLPNPR